MTREFKLPDLGEGVHEGHVVRLHVQQGQTVREDEPLMEVETDKAAVEIPSPYSGVVSQVHIQEDQVVHVGDVMFTFSDSAAESEAKSQTSVEVKAKTAESTNGTSTAVVTAPHRRTPASPAVRKLARSLEIDIDSINGSGPGGRVTRSDVEQAAQSTTQSTADTKVKQRHSPATPQSASAPAPSPTRQPIPSRDISGTADSDAWGDVVRQPISRPRRAIAQNMTQAWTSIPHVTDCDDADVTELDRMRKQFNDQHADEHGKLTLLPFVVRAVALALQKHPIFNASFDAEREEIVYHKYISINVGVQTERGLVAPVIRDADRLGALDLHQHIEHLTERARSATFEVNDLKGGTFTISNAGAMGGSRYATPIINSPQVACLAVGRSKSMPWVVDNQIVPRLIMPLSISFDHRIIDGAEEITFQRTIIAALENPVHLM